MTIATGKVYFLIKLSSLTSHQAGGQNSQAPGHCLGYPKGKRKADFPAHRNLAKQRREGRHSLPVSGEATVWNDHSGADWQADTAPNCCDYTTLDRSSSRKTMYNYEAGPPREKLLTTGQSRERGIRQ